METVTALIPAHNEADALPATIASLRSQTRPPDRIIVISDNSTDDTLEVALKCNSEVMETVGNTFRKAGALNQALATLDRSGLVLVMDADTALSERFIEAALRALEDPAVGGAGALFHGPRPTSYLQLCQYLEWQRYSEQSNRTGKTFIMSGTAALIRWSALESVRHQQGHWYDTATITEDSRLSIDLKMAGWKLRSPAECTAVTETMPTVRMLFLQRRRWNLGALQNIRDAGLSRITAPYFGQQIMLALSVFLMSLLISLTVIAVALYGMITPAPFWLAVGLIFATERVITVWDQPIRYRIFAALIVPELIYAWILQSAYLAALWQFLRRSEGVWAHLTPSAEPQTT